MIGHVGCSSHCDWSFPRRRLLLARDTGTTVLYQRALTVHSVGVGVAGGVIFFGVRIMLGTILGRFSIIYFRGLGLRIKVMLWVMVRVRVGVGIRVSVVLWSW